MKSNDLNPDKKMTIYQALKEKLKREPTHHEMKKEVARIIKLK